MIEELKILTKTGIVMYSGKIDLDEREIKPTDQGEALFAGFISAIISISEETQDSEIRELGYREHKIIFAPTENLLFLAFANQKVPNDEVQAFLNQIIKDFLKKYDDDEYPYVDEEMHDDMTNIIYNAFKKSFWWAIPSFNFTNNRKLVLGSLFKPGSTYYINYLPNIFLLTALLGFLVPLIFSYIFGTVFTGFSTNPQRLPDIRPTFVSMLLIWLGPPLLMEILNRDKFNFLKFLIASGIFFTSLIFMVFFSSYLYQEFIFQPIFNAAGGLGPLINVFLFLAPINVSFFFYIVVTAYAGSFVNELGTIRYYTTYILSVVLMISIGELVPLLFS